MNLYHSPHCPAAVLYGVELYGIELYGIELYGIEPQRSTPILELAFDRERLQRLIDLLSRYDLDDECGSVNADLNIELRAFGPLQS